ncbi:MAG TPA: polyprenyl diphosphate synthase [Dissulfurispiraceae bacterium]|nr:polyprenyl diphosphate synthase [Dissulfurispiraceae bacterium]
MTKRRIPRHIGIIMDGNGRWAELRGLPRSEGHKLGVERAREIVMAAKSSGVEAVSLYAFSIENWMRPEQEVSMLMDLLESTLRGDLFNVMREGIRFRVIGNREKLSETLVSLIGYTEEMTKDNKEITLQCALSYSGRDEIVRAVRKAVALRQDPAEISEDLLSVLLDTAGVPDPDFIIRTSGEERLSNFMIWQAAYAEFYFTNTLWPDFTKEEFLEAIYEFQMRERRFGRVPTGVL